MDTSLLAERVREYRKYTGLNMTLFAERIGVSYKVLSRLERGGEILQESRDIFISALNIRNIKPGEIQCWPDGRRMKKSTATATLAAIELSPPLDGEVTRLLMAANRYDQLTLSWARSTGRFEDARITRALIKRVISGLSVPVSQVSILTYCLMVGLVQGIMLRDGVLTITEVLEDQNTFYYVPPQPTVGKVHATSV